MPPCKVRAANRAATLRKMTSSLSQHDDESSSSAAAANVVADHANNASRIMTERTESMASRASSRLPLTRRERNDVANSLRNIAPAEGAADIDWEALEGLLSEAAHLSHKDWGVTGRNSERMARILLGGGPPPPPRDDDDDGDDTANNDAAANSNKNGNGKGSTTLSESPAWNQMFERILHEGNWDGALAHAAKNNNDDGRSNINNAADAASAKPWAVLVTGVNGIRKTTSVYQPWFSEVLREALVVPRPSSSSEFESQSKEEEKDGVSLRDLPNGENSFFRQLDHMITTLCNEDFSLLYALTAAQLETESNNDDDDEGGGASDDTNATVNADTNSTTTTTTTELHNPLPPPPPSKELVKRYSNLKASIFSRYRTLSELLGVLLLREARTLGINVMCETSGRDIAMFRYIDHFFPKEEEEKCCGGGGGDNRCSSYNKLALHFTIDDLSHAERSVDERMAREMTAGKEAVRSGDVVEVIYANAGGPYGSEVLEGVRADSERVWDEVVMKGGGEGGNGVGEDWYKATMRINAHDEKPWTIRAVRPDGSLGTEYTFGDARTV